MEMAAENDFDMDVIAPLLMVTVESKSEEEDIFRWYWQAYRTWVPYSTDVSNRIEHSYQSDGQEVSISDGRSFRFAERGSTGRIPSSSVAGGGGHSDVMAFLAASTHAPSADSDPEAEVTVIEQKEKEKDTTPAALSRANVFGLQYVTDAPGRHRKATRLLVPPATVQAQTTDCTLRHMSFGTLQYLDGTDGHSSRLTALEKETCALDLEYCRASMTRTVEEQLSSLTASAGAGEGAGAGKQWLMAWEES
jgi:hypothetical protein